MARHRSAAVPLAWLYVGLILYASLYPFVGWTVPGNAILGFVTLPWSPYWTWFDLVINLVGYMPLGALVFGSVVRNGWHTGRAALIAWLGATLLSFTMETLQNFVPQRVPSNVDLGLNSLGALLGIAFGAWIHVRGGVDRWQRARDRWFVARSAGGVALLLLWPVGLLFPTAVPFGLGHVLGRMQQLVGPLLDGTPFENLTANWNDAAPDPTQLSASSEVAIVVFGVLAPCLVAFTISMPGWRRVVLVVGGVAIGLAATTLSTALNFGPQHAFAWATGQTLQSMAIGTAAAAMLSLLPRRAAAGFGLIVLTALVMLVAQAPADPYFAQSLQAWEQGRFIRFHGAAQWVGWLWPYAALTYLLVRVATRASRGFDAA